MTDDKLTIEDLLIRRSLPERGLRDASEADLLAVLEGLGAEKAWFCPTHKSPWYENEGLCQRAAAAVSWNEQSDMGKDCIEPRTYLVWRIEP